MLLKLFLATTVLASTFAIFCKDNCKASGVRCTDPYTFQICVNMSEYAVGTSDPQRCPDGAICTDQGLFPCKIGTVPIPTTLPPPTTVPACFGPSNFSTNSCNSYFQCIQVMWWFQPEVRRCPDGQNFSPLVSQCVSAEEYRCGTTSTTVTPGPQVPKCNGEGLLPGPAPNQYYDCQFIWFQWQPQLKTCPDGQNFDVESSQCVAVARVLSFLPQEVAASSTVAPVLTTNRLFTNVIVSTQK